MSWFRRRPAKWGTLLLGIWLLLTGLLVVFPGFSLGFVSQLLPFLAIVAGVLIIIDR